MAQNRNNKIRVYFGFRCLFDKLFEKTGLNGLERVLKCSESIFLKKGEGNVQACNFNLCFRNKWST